VGNLSCFFNDIKRIAPKDPCKGGQSEKMSMVKTTTMSALLSVWCIFSLIIFTAVAQAFCFEEAGKAHGISSELLKSIARVESGLNSGAVNTNRNGSTDLGLMQINSAWIDILNLKREELITDPCYNVMTGAGILRRCIDRHGYTWESVGCYNAKSKGKREGYSWKIYRELKREKTRSIAKERDASPDTGTSVQSLQFRVRDAEKPDCKEEP
jgi:hypothetical protein